LEYLIEGFYTVVISVFFELVYLILQHLPFCLFFSLFLIFTLFFTPGYVFLFEIKDTICVMTPCILVGTYLTCGPGSVVGIATGYGLDGPEIESM
jgi:hypothetical protein